MSLKCVSQLEFRQHKIFQVYYQDRPYLLFHQQPLEVHRRPLVRGFPENRLNPTVSVFLLIGSEMNLIFHKLALLVDPVRP